MKWYLFKTSTSICSPHHILLCLFFFSFKFIYFNWRLITLQYCIGFAIHQHESAMGVHVFPILNPPRTSLPVPSLWVISVHQPQASCILRWTWTGDSFLIWYYTCFNAILPNHPTLPSPTESKRLFYTSVSLLLSHIQGYHYHLSKFHIYALVYCIGVFLSGVSHQPSLSSRLFRMLLCNPCLQPTNTLMPFLFPCPTLQWQTFPLLLLAKPFEMLTYLCCFKSLS